MKKEYRNSVRTKKMIKTAFNELLAEKKSMNSINVRDLCERADIAKSTFYNHYDDIYAVAEEFENDLIENISRVLDKIECDKATEYEAYIKEVVEFLKVNEEIYGHAIACPDIRFFIEKLKTVISKKIFVENTVFPFSDIKEERYAQIRFLTNACVDTVVDYFRGVLDLTVDEVGGIILDFLKRLKA